MKDVEEEDADQEENQDQELKLDLEESLETASGRLGEGNADMLGELGNADDEAE